MNNQLFGVSYLRLLVLLLAGFLLGCTLYVAAYAHNHDSATRELQPAGYASEVQPAKTVRVIQPAQQDQFYQPANAWLQGDRPNY